MKNIITATKIFFSFVLVFTFFKFSNAAIYEFKQTYSGAQENPPVITNGTGTITGTYNDVTNSLSFTSTFSGLTGTTTAAHFHGPAAVGANAGVAIGYASFPLGVTSGTYSNTYTLTAAQETQFLSNLWYSNIHTTFAGGGELRAQVLPKLRTLNLTYIIEGFYDVGSNLMVSDLVTVNLRNSTSPYALVDNSTVTLSTSGNGIVSFGGASVSGVPYYVQVLHRNALETWNAAPVSFAASTLAYNFTTSDAQAFGNNLVLKGTKYCAYSGDPNADGSIDVTDIVGIFNDASNFVSGYVITDLTGDDFVDVADLSVGYNNSINFVGVQIP
ncbi:MAG: CHRD domain-containing protein [bacterium]|nr:CHRD domain-containing protein [bacterium]